ncbi:MAG TPA: hypothetical protein VN940_03925 [Candidatus Dormibacteraeota bacterium]|nr:hypothetical protein [Candidatus Dormibacteraeota bacterium]
MEDLGLATEDQVILAWLQAEIESVGFQQYLAGEPANPVYLALALKAARSPNLRDADQNQLRRRIIVKTHGFGVGIKSFEGLANDVGWRRARLSSHEVGELLYANGHAAWTTLAPVTRKVAEGASNIGHVFTGDMTNMLVLALALRICESNPPPKLPEIICLARPDGHLVLMEGHTRATAIALEGHRFTRGVNVFIGRSPSVASWAYL